MSGFFGDSVGIEFTEWGIYHFIPIFGVIIGVLVIYLLRNKIRESKHEKAIRYTIASLGIFFELSLHLWRVANGTFALPDSLPIGLCSFSMFLGIYIMFSKNFKVFEIAYFWCLGGVVSVLFPDILYGPDRFRYYQFLFSHMIFFFMYMYMMFVHGFIPTFKSFKKSFILLLAVVLLFIVPVNLIFNANYMYLREPGDTPFEIFWGHGYPLYLTGCILLAMVVITAWYAPVAIYNRMAGKKNVE